MNNSNDSHNQKYEFTKDWFSKRESSWLEHFGGLANRPSTALEIGSLEGRSAVWMLENLLLDSESHLICIDLFGDPEVEDRFDRNIVRSGAATKIEKLKGVSWRHLRSLKPESFDLVYVDGSHHGRDVLEDAILSYRLLRTGGFLVFDDYPWKKDNDHSVYPKEAIDAFLHLYQEFVEVLQVHWQVFLRKTG